MGNNDYSHGSNYDRVYVTLKTSSQLLQAALFKAIKLGILQLYEFDAFDWMGKKRGKRIGIEGGMRVNEIKLFNIHNRRNLL